MAAQCLLSSISRPLETKCLSQIYSAFLFLEICVGNTVETS